LESVCNPLAVVRDIRRDFAPAGGEPDWDITVGFPRRY